jgi:hypothetical protein
MQIFFLPSSVSAATQHFGTARHNMSGCKNCESIRLICLWSRSPLEFLVDEGAWMMVASTIVPVVMRMDKQSWLWQQAAYNEAVVHREMGYYQQCVLMLTELLGDLVPDLGKRPRLDIASRTEEDKGKPVKLGKPIEVAARVARLGAFSQYSIEDWASLPASRANLLVGDAEGLVQDLCDLRKLVSSVRDERILKYMLAETLRAGGHVELHRVIQILGPDRVYDVDNRPTKLKDNRLNRKNPKDRESIGRLLRGIRWMKACEDLRPSCGLFSDLAESFLLLSSFREAQGYSRHATLGAGPNPVIGDGIAEAGNVPIIERAFYLAAESYLLDEKPELAKRYAQRYAGTVTLDEFKAIRKELQIADQPTGCSIASEDPEGKHAANASLQSEKH